MPVYATPFYYDSIYWILLIPVLVLSIYAQAKVSGNFNKYSQVRNRRHITGAQAAYEVLRAHGITAVSYTHLDVYKRQLPGRMIIVANPE